MRFRKLRIAWSVGWGVVAFAIAVYIYEVYLIEQSGCCEPPYEPNPKIDYQPYVRASILPIAIAIVAGASCLPWWSDRFSLRTLLLAITAVAVVLGVAVWAGR